jgi:RNA recognition motif-containing protein
MGCRLFVGNLPFELPSGKLLSEEDLRDRFVTCGTIVDVMIVRDPATRRPRGFAFLEFATPDQAKIALDAHGTEFHGRALAVQLANPRTRGDREISRAHDR